MQIGLPGGSKQQSSLPFNAERTVNMYLVLDKEGKAPAALYGTPGLLSFATAGVGPGRGCFTAANGRAFVVTGPDLFEVNSNGTSTYRGTLLTGNGIVQLEENGVQLGITDGQYLYMFTYGTNAFVRVTDADLPLVGTLTFLGGYFIISNLGTGKFYISALYNGLSWAALDFATAESSPDQLLLVINVAGQLWLLGSESSEIWANTGAANFPFQLIGGATLNTGILAPYSASVADSTLFWVGRDRNGSGIVYRAQGFTPLRISDEPTEKKIQAAPQPALLRSWTYQEQGHIFYVITGGGMETSLVYDLTTQIWCERAYLNEYGEYTPHRGSACMFAFGKTLVCDRENNKIYDMKLDYYSDDGDPMPADRIFTHVFQENERFISSTLTVGIETGVGLNMGQGIDPQITLSLSNDGARTWFTHITKTFGRIGKFIERVTFHRLGQARIRTYRLRITDPVPRRISGAFLNA